MESDLDDENTVLMKGEEWDVFQEIPRTVKSGSMKETALIDFGEKLIKFASYIVTFGVVLGSAVISKSTLLFMTSQIKPNTSRPYCNLDLDTNKQYLVTLPTTERVAWIWYIFFAYCVPQVGILIRSLRIFFFKNWSKPSLSDFIIIFFTETFPAIGSALLVYNILPELDVIQGAMLTNAVCFVPAILSFFCRGLRCSTTLSLTLDLISIIAQASSFIVWPLIGNKPVLWLIPVSVIFISIGWWENYITEDAPIGFISQYAKNRSLILENNRYFVYIFASLWKCFCFFITMIISIQIREGESLHLFTRFNESFSGHEININEIETILPNLNDIIDKGAKATHMTWSLTPFFFFLINISATYICYIFGKFTCKVYIQDFSYAFPINITMPVTLSLLISLSGNYLRDVCEFNNTIPSYLFFHTPEDIYFLRDFIIRANAWIWLIWLLSQAWVTLHIWKPNCERLARTEKLYVRPMYDPFLIDQDIAMNRRKIEERQKAADDEEEDEGSDSESESMSSVNDKKENPETKKIYACATMWHEEKEEMMQFLKSIMRLDMEQYRLAKKKREEGDDIDYFELETHIFFDDAFDTIKLKSKDELTNEEKCEKHLNKYVTDLIMCVSKAVKETTLGELTIDKPITYRTPYGGRIKWILPGKTKMIAHLKDKNKIRHKKRWSQVMYMYYLLGYKLAANENYKQDEIVLKAENTYILALDGDIDFLPKAVLLLVDLMRKNDRVGAACGRIHPVGSGPMAWYQMFEYAIGHWLQKATEHMIGCVLCSPGCFSLFRGSALMQPNVMRKYTTMATEAMHHVQYDQGEDRWLCTLLLQQGLRVEYSAASDAYTHCPETFNEFYNQRRRWMPSTTANILDLLVDYKSIIKVNDSISRLYIVYQVVLMVGTVLGPGTIFLMLVGAFVAAFQMDQWSSFMWNLLPILIFIFACKNFKKDAVQLFFASIISAVYGLIMMAVLVGVLLQISQDGWMAPSSLFFFCVAGEMIITAILHPKELGCLLYGVVYYVTVPSMYLLLVIYSVFNMNVISWGTREGVIKKPDQEEVAKKAENKTINIFSRGNDDSAGSLEFSFAGLFKCMFCTHTSKEKVELNEIKGNIKLIMQKLEIISEKQEQQTTHQTDNNTPDPNNVHVHGVSIMATTEYNSINESPEEMWMDEDPIRNTEVAVLSDNEKDFWVKLIEKYLFPIPKDEAKEAQLTLELADLRDRAVGAFLMINSLFVLVVFLLTLKKDDLHIKWPFDVKTNWTFERMEDFSSQITLQKQYLQLEPIGFVFLIFFGILLVVQFLAMLFHRFGTLCHILANTEINIPMYSHHAEGASIEEDIESNVRNTIVGNTAETRRKTLATFIKAETNEPAVSSYDNFYVRRNTAFRNTMVETRRPTAANRRPTTTTDFEGFDKPYKPKS